jgi:antitoxin YefM
MAETTFSQLRANLKGYCEQAVANREPIRVHRRNGEDVVLLAADEYDRLAETAHVLSSPRNAVRLLEALARAHQGTVEPATVEELCAALGL